MKKITMALMLLATVSTAVAQEQGSRAGSDDAKGLKQQRMESLKTDLGMDAEQVAKYDAINADLAEQRKALRAGTLSEEDRQARSRAMNEEHKAAVRGILTPEQVTRMEALAKERRASGKQQSADPAKMQEKAAYRAEKQTHTMSAELGLDEAQTEKVKTINGTYSASLAKAQQAGLDDEARKARMTELRNTRDKELKAVLSAEQYARMVELRKEKRNAKVHNE